MLRIVPDKRLICAIAFPFGFFSNQDSDGETSDISSPRVMLTKFRTLVYNENGTPTKEAQSVINATGMGVVSGFFLGGLIRASDTPERFKRENQASVFKHKFDAYKKLQYKVGRDILRGGIPLAARLGLFCFMFSSITTGLYIYREKYDILNHICGGTLTGCLYKMHMGFKSAIAGSVLGFMLGTISGAITSSLLFITGYDMEKVYEGGTIIPNARREQLKKQLKKQYVEEEEELFRVLYEDQKKM